MENKTSSSEKKPSPLPWYKEGLKFKCTGCGKCCTGAPGYVWITENEMIAMASSLQIPLDLFKRKYVRRRGNRYSLTQRKSATGDYDCVFLKDKKCEVYDARPMQCKTFPWWPENVNSPESWKLTADECEGINKDAPTIPHAEIEKQLNLNDS